MTGKNGEIPYQAESYAYNPDYTELTIKLKPERHLERRQALHHR